MPRGRSPTGCSRWRCVGLGGIAILGAIFAPWIIRAYNVASHASGDAAAAQLALGTFFLRWFMPQIVFYGIGAIAGGLLNAHRRFAPPMFTPILNNVVVIATFGLYAWLLHGAAPGVMGIDGPERYVLAIGTTLGVALMTIALWPSLRRLGYRWHLRFDWNHPALRRLARLAGWVVLYVVANQAAYFVIIVLNGRVRGGLTAYAAAFIVVSLPHAIFVVSIFTALIPGMAGQWTEGHPAGVRELFSRGVRDTAVIILPAALGLDRPRPADLPSDLPARELGPGGRRADRARARRVRRGAPRLLDLPAVNAHLLLDAGHAHARPRERRRCRRQRRGRCGVHAGAAWGVPGLALGWAVSYGFGTVVMMIIMHGRLGGIDGRRIAETLARVTPAAVGAAVLAWASTLPFGAESTGVAGQLGVVLVGVCVGVLAFVILALIFRVREVDDVKTALLRRFRG